MDTVETTAHVLIYCQFYGDIHHQLITKLSRASYLANSFLEVEIMFLILLFTAKIILWDVKKIVFIIHWVHNIITA